MWTEVVRIWGPGIDVRIPRRKEVDTALPDCSVHGMKNILLYIHSDLALQSVEVVGKGFER